MTTTCITEELKDVLGRISGMCFRVELALNICIDGFIKHNIDLINSAQEETIAISEEGNKIRKLLSDKAAERTINNEKIKSLLAVLNSIGLAVNGLDSMLRNVRFKICEKIIFSDMGLNEIRNVFNAILDFLKTAGEAISTRNSELAKYVFDKSCNLEKLAVKYAETNEDRLITGECPPEASPVFVNIVDGGLTLVWHIKKAVIRMFEQR